MAGTKRPRGTGADASGAGPRAKAARYANGSGAAAATGQSASNAIVIQDDAPNEDEPGATQSPANEAELYGTLGTSFSALRSSV